METYLMIKELDKTTDYVKYIMNSKEIQSYFLNLNYVSLVPDMISLYNSPLHKLKILITWSSSERESSLMIYTKDLKDAKGLVLSDLIKLTKEQAKQLVLMLLGRIYYNLYQLDFIIEGFFTFENNIDEFHKIIGDLDTTVLKRLRFELLEIRKIDQKYNNYYKLSNTQEWVDIYDIIEYEIDQKEKSIKKTKLKYNESEHINRNRNPYWSR